MEGITLSPTVNFFAQLGDHMIARLSTLFLLNILEVKRL